MTFFEKLDAVIEKSNSLLCVGLDPDFEKLPDNFKTLENPQFEFNKKIIDETHDVVCVYKPNSAFYEARGAQGILELKMTCEYISQQHTEIPILLDFKRADIGNTNNGYVSFAYDYLNVDAVTLHPYLGYEALKPFLQKANKGNFILCKTSNAGSGEIQDLTVNDNTLYAHIAQLVSQNWNDNNNCGLVVGATHPEELKTIRAYAPDIIFLIPGIGAQGGDLEKTLINGLNSSKKGLIISSSRGIIFSDSPRAEAEMLRNEINSYR